MKKILIASPVRQSPTILHEFLGGLARLCVDDLQTDYVFVDDNEEPSAELAAFAADRSGVVWRGAAGRPDYIRGEDTHHWQDELMWRVAEFKDRFLRYASDRNYDYVLLVDSDLVLHPLMLKRLVAVRQDIVSETFWTSWWPGQAPLPQVWVSGQYTLFEHQSGEQLDAAEQVRRTEVFLNRLREPGLYEVGGLGACTLLSRQALERGVCFAPIHNLELCGEDRHFCVRAAVLGLRLYADTYYPPLHLYRDTEVMKVPDFIRACEASLDQKITLAMMVRNEAARFLPQVLRAVEPFIDHAVILDDASEDETVSICRTELSGKLSALEINSHSMFHEEHLLRRKLWDMAVQVPGDWILVLDADEELVNDNFEDVRARLAATSADLICARLYDMWDERHYREDGHWQAHTIFRPFLVRHRTDIDPAWFETPQHCGRFPRAVWQMKKLDLALRIKHWGWARAEDRVRKFLRYQQLDPNGKWGDPVQYLSILDPYPTLKEWEEDVSGAVPKQ